MRNILRNEMQTKAKRYENEIIYTWCMDILYIFFIRYMYIKMCGNGICVPICSCGTISNFVQHQALSMLYQKCWINISYQSKVVVAYGLLSSINKTHVWIELPWLGNFLLASKFISHVKNGMKEFLHSHIRMPLTVQRDRVYMRASRQQTNSQHIHWHISIF